MRILIAAATDMEAAPLVTKLGQPSGASPRLSTHLRDGRQIDVLITGVGMVAAAAWCAGTLARTSYDLALGVGVCGSFDPSLPPGTVVHVVSDRISELGAEDGDLFLTIQEMKLLGDDEPPFRGGRLVNERPPENAALAQLPAVNGITVNTVHGRDESIAAARRRFDPQVETMEGAAFMYVCLTHGVPFAQVRAVSNVVERRNRERWKLADAIANLAAETLRVLDHA